MLKSKLAVKTKSAKLLASCMLGAFIVTGCASMGALVPQTVTSSDADMAVPFALDAEAGQVLQIILPDLRGGAEAKEERRTYFATAVDLARQYGNETLGQVRVTQTLVGESKPDAAIFYAFPDEASRDKFQAHPRTAEFKAQRRKGWRDLRVFSTTLDEDLSITFDPSKTYTLAVAWANPANPGDYDRYLDGIEPDFERIGARFVKKFRNLSYESHASQDDIPPMQLTLVEWDSPGGLQKLTSGEAYKTNSQYFQSGVSDFQLFQLNVAKSS